MPTGEDPLLLKKLLGLSAFRADMPNGDQGNGMVREVKVPVGEGGLANATDEEIERRLDGKSVQTFWGEAAKKPEKVDYMGELVLMRGLISAQSNGKHITGISFFKNLEKIFERGYIVRAIETTIQSRDQLELPDPTVCAAIDAVAEEANDTARRALTEWNELRRSGASMRVLLADGDKLAVRYRNRFVDIYKQMVKLLGHKDENIHFVPEVGAQTDAGEHKAQ